MKERRKNKERREGVRENDLKRRKGGKVERSEEGRKEKGKEIPTTFMFESRKCFNEWL